MNKKFHQPNKRILSNRVTNPTYSRNAHWRMCVDMSAKKFFEFKHERSFPQKYDTGLVGIRDNAVTNTIKTQTTVTSRYLFIWRRKHRIDKMN